MNIRHLVIFLSILILFYGCIFFRIEAFPFSDWGLFVTKTNVNEVRAYTMAIKDQNSVSRIYLNMHPGLFNKVILKVEELNRKDYLDKYITKLIASNLFQNKMKDKFCPCSFIIYQHKPKLMKNKILYFKEIYFERLLK